MGRVCEKHNEFYETECRWCEPLPNEVAWKPYRISGQEIQQHMAAEAEAFWRAALGAGNQPNMQQVQSAIDDCWTQTGRLNQQAQQQAVLMPAGYGAPDE